MPIARVEGTADYVATMIQLTAWRAAPSFLSALIDEWYLGPTVRQLPYFLIPWLKPEEGSEAEQTMTNATLQMLTSLASHAQHHLSEAVNKVAISTPMSLDDSQWRAYILPSVSAAGLRPISELGDHVNAMEAAAFANGYLRCKDYTNLPACYSELGSEPFERVMTIQYTKSALSALFAEWLHFPEPGNSFVDTTLGAAQLSKSVRRPGAAKARYWVRLRKRLRKLRDAGQGDVQRLVLLGESAQDEGFLDNVKKAFAGYLPELPGDSVGSYFENTSALKVNPLFAASLGAAEMAKRALEAPKGCVEQQPCQRKRKTLTRS